MISTRGPKKISQRPRRFTFFTRERLSDRPSKAPPSRWSCIVIRCMASNPEERFRHMVPRLRICAATPCRRALCMRHTCTTRRRRLGVAGRHASRNLACCRCNCQACSPSPTRRLFLLRGERADGAGSAPTCGTAQWKDAAAMRHDHRLERRWTHDITGLRRDFPTLLRRVQGISGEA